MYHFSDIFRKSFLQGWASNEIDATAMIATMIASMLIALYIFFIYRVITKKAFYNKSFNISLAGITLITSAVILTIQSNLIVSLGMVGALSIVRFRTAIKDPMDLMFLFWAISSGIICGAGLTEFAIILSLVLTVVMLLLEKFPISKAPMILVVNSNDINSEDEIVKVVKNFAKYFCIKSRNMQSDSIDLTIELRTSKSAELIKSVNELNCVQSTTLLSHNGETNFL